MHREQPGDCHEVNRRQATSTSSRTATARPLRTPRQSFWTDDALLERRGRPPRYDSNTPGNTARPESQIGDWAQSGYRHAEVPHPRASTGQVPSADSVDAELGRLPPPETGVEQKQTREPAGNPGDSRQRGKRQCRRLPSTAAADTEVTGDAPQGPLSGPMWRLPGISVL